MGTIARIALACVLLASGLGMGADSPSTQPATQPMYPLLPMPKSRAPANDEVAELRAANQRLANENAALRAQLAIARNGGVPPSAVPYPEPSIEDTEEPRGYSGGTYAGGSQTYVGPRGGVYHYSKNGKKVYEKRR